MVRLKINAENMMGWLALSDKQNLGPMGGSPARQDLTTPEIEALCYSGLPTSEGEF